MGCANAVAGDPKEEAIGGAPASDGPRGGAQGAGEGSVGLGGSPRDGAEGAAECSVSPGGGSGEGISEESGLRLSEVLGKKVAGWRIRQRDRGQGSAGEELDSELERTEGKGGLGETGRGYHVEGLDGVGDAVSC